MPSTNQRILGVHLELGAYKPIQKNEETIALCARISKLVEEYASILLAPSISAQSHNGPLFSKTNRCCQDQKYG